MNRGSFKLILFFLVIFTCAAPLMAGGTGEDRIKNVEKLMQKRQYNEAMRLLGEIAKTEPEKLERVYQIMDKINVIWNQYTEKLDKLITEEGDYEEILNTINELTYMNPNPNASGMITLELAKSRANRIGNRNYFSTLMDEALALLNKGEHYKAIELYAGVFTANPAFDLNKKEYEEAKLGNIIKPVIDEEIKIIMQNINTFLQKIPAQKKNIEKWTTELNQFSDAEMQELTDQIISGFLVVLEIASTIKSSYDILELQRNKLVEQDNNTIISSVNYLTYFHQLITGRAAYKEQEGVLNTLNGMVTSEGDALIAFIKQQADENFSRAMEYFTAQAYDESQNYIKTAYNLYSAVVQFAYFTDKKEKLADYSTIIKKGWNFEESLTHYLNAIVDVKRVSSYQVLIAELEELPFFTQRVAVSGVVTGNEEIKEEIETIKNEVIRILNSVREIAEDWQTFMRFGSITLGAEFDKQNALTIIDLCGNILSRFITEYMRIMGLIYTDFVGSINKEIDLMEKGVLTKRSDNLSVTGELMKFFPGQRRTAFLQLKKEMAAYKANLTEVSEIWLSSEELAVDSAELSRVMAEFASFLSNIGNTESSLDNLVAQAEAHIREGLKFKDEGMLRFQQAEAAVNKADYITARKRIADASDAFDKSLFKNEDADVRRYREVTLLELDKKIGNAENVLVIREVNKLKKDARDFYSQGLYDEAETALIKAQSRWADVKTEKDAEIEEWLGYVRTANTIKRAREIPLTDPLYKEMSLLANYANRNYSDGLDLKRAGKPEEASIFFDEADKKVLRILLSFPYNNDARVLRLRIQREMDPAAFSREIEQRIKESRDKLAAVSEDNQRDGYNSLKDILAIDPNNRTVMNEIIKAEYKLKIRLPEPDPKAISESKRLTDEARKIIDNKNRDLFAAALASLNEAIKKNPNNDQARRLKDEIYILEGSQQTSVISKAAMDLYDNALEYYLAGNYLAAKQVVDQAWGDPRNQGYRKLQELREKIEVKL